MNVLVQTKDLEATGAIRQFIDDQLQKILKLGLPVKKVQAHLEYIERKNSDEHRAQVQFSVGLPGQADIVVKESDKDLYRAITKATHSLIRHLRKSKEKKVDKVRRRQIATAKEMEE